MNTGSVRIGYTNCLARVNNLLKPQVLNVLPNAENFLRHCDRQDHKPKSPILKQGEICDSLYLILDGSVSVMVEDDSTPDQLMVVTYLNPGDFVGELGLFDDEPQGRSAMVVAKNQCEVARISYSRFHQIKDQYPDVLFAISRQLGSRLRQICSPVWGSKQVKTPPSLTVNSKPL